MVDATDFATRESGINASDIVVELYGALRGSSTAMSLIASDTGSLTKAIAQVDHGTFELVLAPGDLSGTGASFYDQYLFFASATGCAQQEIHVTGHRIDPSDILSAVTAATSLISDVDSQLTLNTSQLSDVESQVDLLATSDYLSNLHSVLTSTLSDILSAAVQTNSRVLLTQSLVSDIDSQLTVSHSLLSDIESQVDLCATSDYLSAVHSDLKSAVGAVSVTIGASDISDIVSGITAALAFGSILSDIYSLCQDIDSQLLVSHSLLSDVDSQLTLNASMISDVDSQLTETHSLISDVDSQLTLNISLISDIDSQLTLNATMIGLVLGDTATIIGQGATIQSLVSDVDSQLTVTHSLISDIESQVDLLATSDYLSNLHSVLTSTVSDILSAAQQANSRALAIQSLVSDIDSQLLLNASMISDIDSQLDVTHSLVSDAESQIDVTHSLLSDVASQVDAGVGLNASALSDIYSVTLGKVLTEPTGEPTFSDPVEDFFAWWAHISIAEIQQTATKRSVRNIADNATIASMVVSDDGTIFTDGAAG